MAKTKPEVETPKAPEVPPGWREADTEFDEHPIWDFGADGPLEGTVIKSKTATVIRRGEEQEVRLLIVEHGTGARYTLWESTNLQDLFDQVGPGTEIQVRFLEMQHLKGGRTLKRFHAIFR